VSVIFKRPASRPSAITVTAPPLGDEKMKRHAPAPVPEQDIVSG
jgi:hypothetical protein